MGRAQSDTYSLMFNKSDNVKVDETFVRKSVLVHVLMYICIYFVAYFCRFLYVNISSL